MSINMMNPPKYITGGQFLYISLEISNHHSLCRFHYCCCT